MTPQPNLTRAAILAADPQQLRLWVAIHIFEFGVTSDPLGFPVLSGSGWTTSYRDITVEHGGPIDNYPDNLGAAWLAAETLGEKYKCSFSVSKEYGSGWAGGFGYIASVRGGAISYESPSCTLSMTGVTPAMALTRAVLLAVTGAE